MDFFRGGGKGADILLAEGLETIFLQDLDSPPTFPSGHLIKDWLFRSNRPTHQGTEEYGKDMDNASHIETELLSRQGEDLDLGLLHRKERHGVVAGVVDGFAHRANIVLVPILDSDGHQLVFGVQ